MTSNAPGAVPSTDLGLRHMGHDTSHQMSDQPREVGFSGTKAAKIVGISYRQLDYWARTELVRPSLTDAKGSGSRREYSYRDLLELRVIKSLLDAGIKLESVRVAFEYLREHIDTDIAAAHLVISGSDVVLCEGDQLIDVMRSAGQGVLNVLAIGGVKDHLDAALFPDLTTVVTDTSSIDLPERVAL